MKQRLTNLFVILAVLLVALVQPIWRHYYARTDVVTLGLDLKGGVSVLLKAQPPEGQQLKPEDVSGLVEVIRNRVDPQGQKEVVITVVGTDRVLVQLPGEKDPDRILKLIGETALLEWVDAADKPLDQGTDITDLGLNVIVSGKDVKKAFVSRDSRGRPAVAFQLKKEGAQKFGQFTANNVGKYLAIALDHRIISSPVIRSAIWGGNGIIEGSFSIDEANLLAKQIQGGALPVPVTVLENRVVGPALGQESVNTSLVAGAIGFLIILLFILLVYRLPGLVADLALLLYVVLVLGYISLFNITLTLPGIAGILLSIGMAIDGNVIIFERLKEEIAWGKTLSAAVDAAFARAWVAILDGNMTTLLGALVLFFFGTGPVKGFAITLSIGVVLSMFSAVFVSRYILALIALKVKHTPLYA